MREMLKELLHGNLNPGEARVVPGSRYAAAAERACAAYDALRAVPGLPPDRLAEMEAAQDELMDAAAEEYFVIGMRLGAALAAELQDKNDGGFWFGF